MDELMERQIISGTRFKFRQWLKIHHTITYTQYVKLPAEIKQKIQREYQKGR